MVITIQILVWIYKIPKRFLCVHCAKMYIMMANWGLPLKPLYHMQRLIYHILKYLTIYLSRRYHVLPWCSKGFERISPEKLSVAYTMAWQFKSVNNKKCKKLKNLLSQEGTYFEILFRVSWYKLKLRQTEQLLLASIFFKMYIKKILNFKEFVTITTFA